MAFDWKEYLDLARFLQGEIEINYSQESAYRSAVSRAYYAAFCHSRNYARTFENFVPSGRPKDHTDIRGHFRNKGRPGIASELDDLRTWRNSCDYDDTVGDLPQKLKSAIENAQDIIDKLK